MLTQLISKNLILSLQKALWTRLKLSQKVENCNANVQKKFTCARLFSLLWAEPCKCDICLISRILWCKWIISSLKEWDFDIWYSLATFRHNFSLQVWAAPFQWKPLILIGKNLWCRVLEANKKQVSLKSYSLKIRIDSVNQILKNKDKVI